MPAFIHRIGTAVPEHRYEQAYIRDTVAGWLNADRRWRRVLDRVFDRAGIEQRYSVLPDFRRGEGPFLDGEAYAAPSTGTRNAIYVREARVLAAAAAAKALDGGGIFGRDDVTHVVTVSCTGFVAPGPDVHLIRDLGLSPHVQRTHVGFMGCYGAFPALRVAQGFCRADPEAVVLVVCVELCTLHLDPQVSLDSLLSTALFADGAGAVVVSARRPDHGTGYALERFATSLSEDDDEMAWTIGDRGFRMRLSGAIPNLVHAGVAAALERLWREGGGTDEPSSHWAVHPGGPAVLDRVEDAMGLPPDSLAVSRSVLADYGNMSSATILFILERLRAQHDGEGQSLTALAFGPGITIESAVLRFA